jgi:hypothetical protein
VLKESEGSVGDCHFSVTDRENGERGIADDEQVYFDPTLSPSLSKRGAILLARRASTVLDGQTRDHALYHVLEALSDERARQAQFRARETKIVKGKLDLEVAVEKLQIDDKMLAPLCCLRKPPSHGL